MGGSLWPPFFLPCGVSACGGGRWVCGGKAAKTYLQEAGGRRVAVKDELAAGGGGVAVFGGIFPASGGGGVARRQFVCGLLPFR